MLNEQWGVQANLKTNFSRLADKYRPILLEKSRLMYRVVFTSNLKKKQSDRTGKKEVEKLKLNRYTELAVQFEIIIIWPIIKKNTNSYTKPIVISRYCCLTTHKT